MIDRIVLWLSDPAHLKALAWALLIIAPGVLVSFANAFARHYSEHKGVVRFVLFVADFLSVLTPRNAPGTLKFPFAKSEPPESDDKESRA